VANRSDREAITNSRAHVSKDDMNMDEEITADFSKEDMAGAVSKNQQRSKQRDRRNKIRRSKYEGFDEEDDESSFEERSPVRSDKRQNNKSRNKARGFTKKLKGFKMPGRRQSPKTANESDADESSQDSIDLMATETFATEDISRHQLEEEEFKQSTATHNMLRQNKKELFELDEMDEYSANGLNQAGGCSLFNLNFGALSIFGGTESKKDETPLDGVQLERLKGAKHDFENKPKVEVILQDLQDPLVEKYEQLEKQQRQQKKELQRIKEAQQDIERREREELFKMKQKMREVEQQKFQQAQAKDSRSLQEAPDLTRNKNSSFVMDISDWVLSLDNNPDTPGKKSVNREHDTPRTNGRDSKEPPLEKLPFNMIEVPTTTSTMDSEDDSRPKSRRSIKKGGRGKQLPGKGGNQKKASSKKIGGWFRRGA